MAVLLKLMLATAMAVATVGCGDRERPAAPVVVAPQATAAPPDSAVPDPRPVVAAFGDSLSAGLGLDAGKSYPDDLQRLIDAAGYQYRVVNLGVSGDTTTNGVERLPSVLALHPAIVILEFGANDGLRGQPVASARQNMQRMIEALQNAGAQIVLAGMSLPRNYGPDYIHAFEQMYVDLGSQYHLVRIPFLLDGVGGIPRLTQQDGLHPTAEGADIMAHTVFQWLRPLLRK
ncbi:MAG: GDSL-type esterase/lipase family protein [Acidobacteriota bacterium]